MSIEQTKAVIPDFITAMLKSDFYSHPVDDCKLIETHISWVILTGDYVYKIKKPVNFGFLDFSTLEKRKFYSDEELRLNQRLAPDLYLSVVKITGTTANPQLDGKDEVFEYAVKMRQFPQEMQLDHVLARNELNKKMLDSIADLIAAFHQKIEVATTDSDYGKPEQVYQPVEENFRQIRDRVSDKKQLRLLTSIEQWSEESFHTLKNNLSQRREKGFVRECHGDLHLRNIAWYKDKPLAFDCLEFNPNFRWIDVINEVAFLVMDLQDHGQHELAQRFLNRYLELSGDYAGCSVLNFYRVYRAMVRAKVDAIRAQQTGISSQEAAAANKEFNSYLQLAQTYTQQKIPQLIITRGMSASGKSTLTQPLLEQLGAIRIRSDVERKRLYNIKSGENAHAQVEHGIYNPEATEKTYLKLVELAESILDAGMTVIVDATFSNLEQRQLFKQLASAKKVPFIILEFVAQDDTLRRRIQQRKLGVSDADVNILENQIKHWRPVELAEQDSLVSVNTEQAVDIEQLVERITDMY